MKIIDPKNNRKIKIRAHTMFSNNKSGYLKTDEELDKGQILLKMTENRMFKLTVTLASDSDDQGFCHSLFDQEINDKNS
jgi:hypothetical protein